MSGYQLHNVGTASHGFISVNNTPRGDFGLFFLLSVSPGYRGKANCKQINKNLLKKGV